jgi:hypothetical protein
MTDTNNPPAFPRDYVSGGHDGMTLRDYFAGQAVMGLIACSNVKELDGQLLAESSYNVADAMMAERGE